MLGEKNDLAHVVRIVSHLAIDGLGDGVGFVANEDSAAEVSVGERGEGVEDEFPTGFPLGDEFVARRGGQFEFGVAITVGLFAVGGEEIRPAGAHIAGHVFDDDGDGVGFRVEGYVQRLVGNLRDGALGEVFVSVQHTDGVGEK